MKYQAFIYHMLSTVMDTNQMLILMSLSGITLEQDFATCWIIATRHWMHIHSGWLLSIKRHCANYSRRHTPGPCNFHGGTGCDPHSGALFFHTQEKQQQERVNGLQFWDVEFLSQSFGYSSALPWCLSQAETHKYAWWVVLWNGRKRRVIMRAKAVHTREETMSMERKASRAAADVFFPDWVLLLPSPCSISSWATAHPTSPCEFRQLYRLVPTTEPLQELFWERGDVHIHAQMSQGVGLIGKVEVAFVHESRSNHRLTLLHNLPI